MTFEDAVVESTPVIASAFRAGKGALKAGHSTKVTSADPRRFTGSVELDEALAAYAEYRHASRWDYGLGYRFGAHRERAIWVEVHTATTSEVQRVLDKLSWLRSFLRTQAPQLEALTAKVVDGVEPFVWLSTSAGTHSTPSSPQARRLSKAGLSLPRRSLHLP